MNESVWADMYNRDRYWIWDEPDAVAALGWLPSEQILIRTWKPSRDRRFEEKLRGVAGSYPDPPLPHPRWAARRGPLRQMRSRTLVTSTPNTANAVAEPSSRARVMLSSQVMSSPMAAGMSWAAT